MQIVNPYSGNSARFYYAAGLDPWLRQSPSETEHLIKMALLTTQHLVVSDNQFLNSHSLQHLLTRKDVLKFLSEPHSDGMLPIAVSLRSGAKNFEEVLANLLLQREVPPIFPWMTDQQQKILDAKYRSKGLKTLGSFFDIAGPGFQRHVTTLNEIVDSQPSSVLHWDALNQKYPYLVRQAILIFLSNASPVSSKNAADQSMDVALKRLLEAVDKNKEEANRSNLFRILSHNVVDSSLLRLLTLKLLDEPYHVNFASMGGYDLTTGTEYAQTSLAETMQAISEEVKPMRPEEILDVTDFPVSISALPLPSLLRIRRLYSFNHLTSALANDDGAKRIYILRDLLALISDELKREPGICGKLGRLRLKAFLPPTSVRDHLAEAGLSTADLAALGGKIGGFLAGEAVGQMVGVFGIGGLLGGTATVLVEHLADATIMGPRRDQEFRQVVHMLLRSKGDKKQIVI